MLHKYDSLMFTLVIESLVSFDPCVSLGKLIKRCKDAIDQKTQDEARQWLSRHISCAAYRLRIGPYEHEFESDAVARELYSQIKRFLKDANDRRVEQTVEQNVTAMLEQVPNLDSKLKNRIITARVRGFLQDRHIVHYLKALRPCIRNPGGFIQDQFRSHIQERFRHQDAQITIETQIDPYISPLTPERF